MTPRFVRWLRGLVDGMVARGYSYRGIAMDVESSCGSHRTF